MRTVFLVPRRSDADSGGHRDKLWKWCRTRWETLFPEIPIYEGHQDEGLFNRSQAINRAARLADADGKWDQAIVIDSDVLLRQSQVQAAIDTAERTGKVTWAHRRWRGIREDWTTRIVADRQDYFGPECDRSDIDVLVERTNPISWSCCFVIPRAVFDDAGGFDERFRGWGWEDLAWQSLACGLYGHERIEGDVLHLWHPRSEERIVQGEPAYTASPQYIANGRLGRRYMYALRRDHRLTDRQEPSSAAELKRDLANLQRDDEKFARLQPLEERAKWDDWWPTLEELRDGAKQARRAVTLLVHTGGLAANWEERSGYLRRSLASLTEQVSGPIVQRVIYSDWGAEFSERLEEIGKPFGFYVAGPAEHQGYTANMRHLWRYLQRRGRGVYVFQSEDDFVFDRPVDLNAMIDTLEDRPELAQLVLLRGAYYPREFENGGILGWPEAEFTPAGTNGTSHLEHRLFWSQNPGLFRRELTANEWPNGPSSERLFGDALLRDPAVRFGLWGSGEAWISHIGEVRAGTAY
jgi:hypothetical protein